MNSNRTQFCVDELWNAEKSFYTNEPKLTRCLIQVGFTLIPNVLFLLMIGLDFLWTSKHSSKSINLNKFNVTRLLICFFAIINSSILLINYGYSMIFIEENPYSLADLLASISTLIVTCSLLMIHHVHRINGRITSGTIFILCLLFSITLGIIYIDSIAFNSKMYSEFENQNASRIFLCILSLLVLNCFTDDAIGSESKTIEDKKNLINKNENFIEQEAQSKEYASFLSRITYFWFTKFIKKAAKEEIQMSDIPSLENKYKIENVSKEFEHQYFKELQKIEEKNRKSNKKIKFNSWHCFKVICKVYGIDFLEISFIKLIFDALMFFIPILLSAMIRFVSNDLKSSYYWHGWLIVIGFVVSSFLKTILLNSCFERGFGMGLKIRSSLTNLIFTKSLKIAPSARKRRTQGEILNLISTDCSKFADFSPILVFIWSCPIQIVVGTYLLYQQLNNAVWVGLLIIILILGVNSVVTHYQKKFYLKEMKRKDERIKLINETLSGINVVKLYAWEKAFIEKITTERDKEINYNKRSLYVELINFLFFSISPTIILVGTISAYVFGIGNEFSAEQAFVSIALFNILQFPIDFMPILFNNLVTCRVSLNRISSFLAEDDLDNYVQKNFDNEMAVVIRKANFTWDKNSTDDDDDEKLSKTKTNENEINNHTNEVKSFVLKDIQLEVPKGSFVAIIGSVGSGKSSFLSAILGEMHLIENDEGLKGNVNISDDLNISYVAQQAWIQNNSFKDNILFGKALNEIIYKKVINACALEKDLKQFEAGDETEIGEKGINLSGGQKQRVCLARACYSCLSMNENNQIILLDDVLSAVDAHVCSHICENVLNSQTGILRNTTRILVTNQLNQLNDLGVDQIILLKNGKIELKCTYDELIEMKKNNELDNYDLKLIQNEETDKENKSNDQILDDEKEKAHIDEDGLEKKKLIKIEKHEKGRVGLKNYAIYLKYFGITYATLALVFLIADNAVSVWARDYLASWTGTKLNSTDIDYINEFNRSHILNYIFISLSHGLFNIIGNLFLVIGIVSTIKLFHEKLLYKILRSPMSFFDTTPLGRIINRFSSDMNSIDKLLPRAIRQFLLTCLNLLASMSIILIKQPSSLLLYFFIFVIYYFVLDLYINSSRQLKRFDSTTRSPVYSHFSETLNGTSTIRAYSKVKDFERESRHKIETNNRALWYSIQGNRWLCFNLESLSSIVLLIVTVQLLIHRETTTGSEVGLLVSYAINIVQFLSSVVMSYSLFETNAISIERINEYCENVEEDKMQKDFKPSDDWPSKGVIEFKNYSTRYREGTNLVLRNINFKVDSQEKIGIVGKTSITLGLFRIIEPAEGQIIIDNIDISQIGLHDLRSKLSIIPQDAILFTGTIRFNLDPFNKHSDDEIYQSLEHAHLKIDTFEKGIHHEIDEGGQNLSCGQRQLICLARALLRKSKILILDEATASIDFGTDELVQKTIRNEFKDCTTITVAHRINTIIDSSKILVLDNSELCEYDEPNNLLENSNSLFYSLVRKSNMK